jgi:hypothetical protein
MERQGNWPEPMTAQHQPLDLAPTALGELRRTDAGADAGELRSRLADDGYLFLPGYLDREEVLGAGRDVFDRMASESWAELGDEPGRARAIGRAPGLLDGLAKQSPPLQRLLYGQRMAALYERLFGEAVRHFDFTWLRAVSPGHGTKPHTDSVFMNRGTPRLLTAWVPLGDIDTVLGGLAILEGSHRREDIKNGYGSRDVDTYCENRPEADEDARRETMTWDGNLSNDPVGLREQLGLRWLTSDYRAGDLLTFSMHTVHIGLDNNADWLRLSCDIRYQPASEPADPRWIGLDPSAHGSRSKVGVIC